MGVKKKTLVPAGQQYGHLTGKTVKENVEGFTYRLLSMAREMADETILHKLSFGDVKSNELFYHKSCYANYINVKYARFLRGCEECEMSSDANLYKAYAMSEVVSHLCVNADIVHKAKDTMAQYNSILRAIEPSAEEETHTTRFVQQRCTHHLDLMASKGHHTSVFLRLV